VGAAHFAGWPLLGMVLLAGIESTDGLSRIEEVTAGLVVALLCAIFVLSARRRVRRARRWLADPLPRDEQEASWT
jgi:hypothetical protein